MTEKKIEVFADKPALVHRALDLVVEKLNQAIAERGQATIVLAGGSTPKPLYEALTTQPLPWERIHVFWGDERFVPPDHPDSNEGMARKAWLDRVPFPPENIHPIPTTETDPATAAQTYEQQLQQFFQVQPGDVPAFDVILLGMGDDGHTASLFPHTDALQVRDRLVTVGMKQGQPRITFTVTLINQARSVFFLVSGADKQMALEHVFTPGDDDSLYPARLIQPQGELWWLLDRAASAQGLPA